MRSRIFYRTVVVLLLGILVLTGCSKASRPDGVDPIYATDFSDGSWEVGDYGTGRVGYADGEYFVTQVGGSDFMWGQAFQNFTDVDIWVNAQQVSGPSNDNTGYGIMCRVSYDFNSGALYGYWFGIGADGTYSIHEWTGNDVIALVDWASSGSIREGNGRVNELRAVCNGSTLQFYVNGVLVAEATDSSNSFGDIGLGGVSFESDSAEFRFDDLEVFQP
jgi:hypothetical protein